MSFLQDQKKGNNPNHDKDLKRNMFSAGIDQRETKILQKRHERRLLEQSYNPLPQKTDETELATTVSDTRSKRTLQKKSYEEQPEENEMISDQDYKQTWRVKQEFKKRKIDVTQQAEEADRSNQNNTEVARMTIASNYDTSKVKIEKKQVEALRKRVQRTRKVTRKNKFEEPILTSFTALGFDGRTDNTKVEKQFITEHGKKVRSDSKRIQHITVVGFPGEVRLGHFESGGTGKEVATALVDFLDKRRINLQNFRIALCDGCNTMTGRHNRAVRNLETQLQRQLLLHSCEIHAIERPLLHLIKVLDGPTDGPESWSGPIGRIITQDVENMELELLNGNMEPLYLHYQLLIHLNERT